MAATTCKEMAKKAIGNDSYKSIDCVSQTISTSKDLLELGDSKGSPLLITKVCKSKNVCPFQTFKPPQSSVLQQVKKFLPQMATAQQELITRLKTEPEKSFDIENVDDCEKVIEMTLALVEHSDSESDCDTNSDGDDAGVLDDAGEDEMLLGPVTEGNLRLPGLPKVAPRIEVLTEQNTPSTVHTLANSIDRINSTQGMAPR